MGISSRQESLMRHEYKMLREEALELRDYNSMVDKIALAYPRLPKRKLSVLPLIDPRVDISSWCDHIPNIKGLGNPLRIEGTGFDFDFYQSQTTVFFEGGYVHYFSMSSHRQLFPYVADELVFYGAVDSNFREVPASRKYRRAYRIETNFDEFVVNTDVKFEMRFVEFDPSTTLNIEDLTYEYIDPKGNLFLSGTLIRSPFND